MSANKTTPAPVLPGRDRVAWPAYVFALALLVAAPLLYGAVDRPWQIALTGGLALALLVAPARLPDWPRARWGLAAVFVAVLALKEILPAAWFGRQSWRAILMGDYGLALPFTHNPSPATALDVALALAVAWLFFLWAKSVAANRSGRVALARILVVSALAVAGVSLWMQAAGLRSIYGLRSIPGWQEFGPFPNRNHTACLLAMGAVMAAGCLARAAKRREWIQLGLAIAAALFLVWALLASKSRGGLFAACCGLTVFGALMVARSKHPGRYAIAFAGALLLATLVLSFGGRLLERFSDPDQGALLDPNSRAGIWRDALRQWSDAPLFGHGLGTFRGFFPHYQTVALDNKMVLHPESSWLQALTEWGVLPMLLLGALSLPALWRFGVDLRKTPAGMTLRSAGLAAGMTLAAHSLVDVPAHRWATAWYALAALAIAFPWEARRGGSPVAARPRRALAFAALAVALLWSAPAGRPAWTPLGRDRVLDRMVATGKPDLRGLDHQIRLFPLEPMLHELAGALKLRDPWRRAEAWRHFTLLNRLIPCSWALPAQEAYLALPHDPEMALHFFSVAISRSGRRADETLNMAREATRRVRGAAAFWEQYVRSDPGLLLNHPEMLSPADGRQTLDQWFAARAGAADLAPYEIDGFYRSLAKYGDADLLRRWIKARPDRAPHDYRRWAAQLLEWQLEQPAWEVLAAQIPEPAYPVVRESLDELRARMERQPEAWFHLQAYASGLARDGRDDEADQLLLKAAKGEKPPEWFLRKAAHIAARRGQTREAVRLLLGE